MSQQFEKLKKLLAELFQFDHADLDFGIYRIMNAKREEISRFLEKDLLPQVKEILGRMNEDRRQALEKELAKLEKHLRDAGVDPDQSPKVKELRAQLQKLTDQTALEEEVYSHLYTFFSRYYDEGDFISKRRYKENVYAIPYNGEEVKLYWANYDQYYIKTSEYFRNYAFRLPSGRRVRFKVIQAEADRDNIKTTDAKKRRFLLHEANPISEENGELVIRFEFRPDEKNRKQEEINKEIAKFILEETKGFEEWKKELREPRPTSKNKDRTLLEKHLADFTARNTFDYFIHKDLGGFLRRELDFYIKNEVICLDDIENESAPRVEEYLAKVKTIRRIGHKIIDFLAQLENFQKKLWLKKKFIWDTQYCITLDRIFAIEDEARREWLLEKILSNEKQIEEWKALYKVHELDEAPLFRSAWDNPSPEKLRKLIESDPRLRYLVVDTRHFDEEFKLKLISSFDNLDEELNGLLVHGENFQALNLLLERYREQVKCIYIDPPYNTGNDEFLYKDNYQHSSWLTMMYDRLILGRKYMQENGAIFISIDDNEVQHLRKIGDILWDPIGTFVWEKKKKGSHLSPTFRDLTEYILAYSPNLNKIGKLYGEKAYSGEWQRLINRANTESELLFPAKQIEAALEDGEYSSGIYGEGEMAVILLDPIKVKDGIVQNSFRMRARFKWKQETLDKELAAGSIIKLSKNMRPNVLRADQEEKTKRPPSLITKDIAAYEDAFAELKNLFGDVVYAYPKPTGLVKFFINTLTYFNPQGIILDYFAGSGTTAHAVINLNREDDGKRKYILVEVADYFDTVLLPRIKKVVFSRDWKDGKPKPDEKGNLNGVSHFFKYIRLESYEDTLNNLELKRTEIQQKLLDENPGFREDYILRYMLEFEARESLLNVKHFEDPFSYEMEIATTTVGDTRRVKVDLVETFNYLIGLRVKTVDHIRGVRVITGENPQGEKVLILWRNTKEIDAEKLNEWFRRQGYNTRDQEFDIIYVNGDNHLENLRRQDHTWKVRLIEEEFLKRMFEVRDI